MSSVGNPARVPQVPHFKTAWFRIHFGTTTWSCNGNLSSLSQELVDEILGWLWDDVSTLRTCSLLCRSFTPACQKELFSTIAALVNAVAGPPYDLYASPSIHAIPSTQKLLVLIESSPHIARYVKSLKIIGGLSHKSTCDDARLALILPSFHRLTAFAIKVNNPEFPPIFLLPIQIVLRMPSLIQVELQNMPLDIIPCGASFKHLSYRNFKESSVIKPPKDNAHADREQLTKLTSLDLGPYCKSPKLLRAISSSTIVDVSHLRRLSLNIASVHGLPERLLRACSNTLEVLKLDHSTLVTGSTEQEIKLDKTQFFDIGSFPALRHLQMRVYLGTDNSYPRPDVVSRPYSWILHILEAIATTNGLEELTILNVYVSRLRSSPHEIEYIPWDILLPLLSKKFPYLRKFNFLFLLQFGAPAMLALRTIVNATHPMAAGWRRSGVLEIREVPVDYWDPPSVGHLAA